MLQKHIHHSRRLCPRTRALRSHHTLLDHLAMSMSVIQCTSHMSSQDHQVVKSWTVGRDITRTEHEAADVARGISYRRWTINEDSSCI